MAKTILSDADLNIKGHIEDRKVVELIQHYATTTVPAERVAAHIGMPHNVAMVRRWLIDAGRKDL